MKVNDIGSKRVEGARKPQRAADVVAPATPADRADIDTETPQVVADCPVVLQEYHGEPVATGIHRLREIHYSERNAAGMFVTGAKHVYDVSDAQARTAVRSF